jgi:vacuolar-type H+-ATPase subunit I/STV1
MKENREGYEQLADRTTRLLAAVASTITKTDPEKLNGLDEYIARLVLWVSILALPPVTLTSSTSTLQEMKSTTEARLHRDAAAAPTKKLRSFERFLRTKSKNVLRVSSDREEINTLGQKLDRAVEELGVRALLFQNSLSVFTRFTRSHRPFVWSSGWITCGRSQYDFQNASRR